MSNLTLALGLSMHLGFEGDYNQFHPHVRWQEPAYMAGVFLNSENDISAYVGQEYMFNDFGLELGVAVGYSDFPIKPFVRGVYRISVIGPAIETILYSDHEEVKPGIVIGFEYGLGKD